MFLAITGYIFVTMMGMWILGKQLLALTRGPPKHFNFVPQEGKVFLVTGGLNGIGRAITERLLHLGAYVILTGRSSCKDITARRSLERLSVISTKFSYYQVNFEAMDEIKKFTEEVKKSFEKIDVLICNAGIMGVPYCKTKDGFESHMAVNYLSNVVILNNLKPLLKRSDSEARVVLVTSAIHTAAYLNLDDLMFTREYSGLVAYTQSKLCQLLYSKHIAKNLLSEDNISINCVHPGVSASSLYSPVLPVRLIAPLLFISTEAAAETVLYCSLAPTMEGITGQYMEDSEIVHAAPICNRKDLQEQLFKQTMSLVSPWI